jgi:hypothetical protein
VFIAIPAFFGFLFWNSYRKERALSERGEGYAPPGRLRWDAKQNQS